LGHLVSPANLLLSHWIREACGVMFLTGKGQLLKLGAESSCRSRQGEQVRGAKNIGRMHCLDGFHQMPANCTGWSRVIQVLAVLLEGLVRLPEIASVGTGTKFSRPVLGPGSLA
jgi:hypothetical protein